MTVDDERERFKENGAGRGEVSGLMLNRPALSATKVKEPRVRLSPGARSPYEMEDPIWDLFPANAAPTLPIEGTGNRQYPR